MEIAGLRNGCSFDDLGISGPVSPQCRSLMAYPRFGILVGETADLVRLVGLDAAQADALARGRLLVNTDPVQGPGGATVNEVRAGRLRWEHWLPDGIHPQARGSRSYADCVCAFLERELVTAPPSSG